MLHLPQANASPLATAFPPLQGWPRDKPFVFDVVSASALCERPDYEASCVVVGLVAAQAWAAGLQVRL